jgi:hypothetical protein
MSGQRQSRSRPGRAAAGQSARRTPAKRRTASLSREAHALTVFRVLKNGEGRAYTATTFPADPFAGCARFLRLARFWLTDDADGYGVLDVLNANGDIVQDFTIKDAAGFQQIKRRLHLRVEH